PPGIEERPLRDVRPFSQLAERGRSVPCPLPFPAAELLREPRDGLFVLWLPRSTHERTDHSYEARSNLAARPARLFAHDRNDPRSDAHERPPRVPRQVFVAHGEERHDRRHIADARREPGL